MRVLTCFLRSMEACHRAAVLVFFPLPAAIGAYAAVIGLWEVEGGLDASPAPGYLRSDNCVKL